MSQENQGRGVVQVLPGRRLGDRDGSQLLLQGQRCGGRHRRGRGWLGGALAAGDFNNSGHADLAVGAAGEDIGSVADAGAVNVLYGTAGGLATAGNQQWFQDSPGVAGISETQDFLGNALAAGDFNGDGRADLAAGAPGETLAVVAEAAGAVNVLYGAVDGLSARGNQVWSQDSAGVADLTEPRDLFGISLTTGDFDGDGRAELAVGASGETLNDLTSPIGEAGVVHVLPGSLGGLTGAGSQLWSQDSPGVADQAEDADRFGSALASGDFNADGPADLAIGAPGQNLGNGFGAGVAHVLPGSNGGLTATGSQLWSQDSPGVAGAPEFLDFFGQTLVASNPSAAEASPGARGAATQPASKRPAPAAKS